MASASVVFWLIVVSLLRSSAPAPGSAARIFLTSGAGGAGSRPRIARFRLLTSIISFRASLKRLLKWRALPGRPIGTADHWDYLR